MGKGRFITAVSEHLFKTEEEATGFAMAKVNEGYLVFCAYLEEERPDGDNWYVELCSELQNQTPPWHGKVCQLGEN